MAQVFDTPINSNDQSLDRVLKVGLPVALIFVDGASALDDAANRLARAHAWSLILGSKFSKNSTVRCTNP